MTDLICQYLLVGCVYALKEVSLHWYIFERTIANQPKKHRVIIVVLSLMFICIIWPYVLCRQWRRKQ
jgi:hypothetical protein